MQARHVSSHHFQAAAPLDSTAVPHPVLPRETPDEASTIRRTKASARLTRDTTTPPNATSVARSGKGAQRRPPHAAAHRPIPSRAPSTSSPAGRRVRRAPPGAAAWRAPTELSIRRVPLPIQAESARVHGRRGCAGLVTVRGEWRRCRPRPCGPARTGRALRANGDGSGGRWLGPWHRGRWAYVTNPARNECAEYRLGSRSARRIAACTSWLTDSSLSALGRAGFPWSPDPGRDRWYAGEREPVLNCLDGTARRAARARQDNELALQPMLVRLAVLDRVEHDRDHAERRFSWPAFRLAPERCSRGRPIHHSRNHGHHRPPVT